MLVHIMNYDVSCLGWSLALPKPFIIRRHFHINLITQFIQTSLQLGPRTYSHNHNSGEFGVFIYFFFESEIFARSTARLTQKTARHQLGKVELLRNKNIRFWQEIQSSFRNVAT